jgi:hypothetical protein
LGRRTIGPLPNAAVWGRRNEAELGAAPPNGPAGLGSGPVNPHSTSTWKNDRYGPVVQELDFLREGAFTGAAGGAGSAAGRPGWGKSYAGRPARCDSRSIAQHLILSSPGVGPARQLWMEPSVAPVRPTSRAKRGGLEGRPDPCGGPAPSSASPDYRCYGTPWGGGLAKGRGSPL